ncbi:metal-dependent hydrolase family protein [Microlunatus soli]|uniref:Imidazolonepropionase n=1 Tax=Microlunatus soli TaxID=630515 RepID=A0A1H1N671_9ACTN|nr:amidohydrolase family protein [Microlunatus soli]SDR94486.1 Imidazolonepropionase [Microlunatus soli]
MSRTVFSNGMIFDSSARSTYQADVAIDGDQIVEIGAGLDGDVEIDCAGLTVVPGMIDCHVHLTMSTTDLFETVQQPFSLQFYEGARNMARTLAAGVTTVRDAAGADQGMRVAQQRGLILGPRMQVSLNMLSQTGGHGDPWWPSTCTMDLLPPHPGRPAIVVDGPEQIRHKVRELVRAGADVIKVATSGGLVSGGAGPNIAHFRDDEITMMVTEAASAGLFVMAHASGPGAKAAVRNGVRSIEHGHGLDDETLSMMVDHGTWLVPTLSSGLGLQNAIAGGANLPAVVIAKIEETAAQAEDDLRRAIDAGVRIAMGTDAPLYPHGRNLDEITLMTQHGMSAADALYAATASAAELLGVEEDRGSLRPGCRADLVIIEGDALDVARLQDRVRAVYQDGIDRTGSVVVDR